MLSEKTIHRVELLNLREEDRRFIYQVIKDAIAEAIEPRAPLLADDWPVNYQSQFWERYGHKRDKASAMKALEKVRKKGVLWKELMDGIDRYLQSWSVKSGYIKHPATFLNAESWKNEYNGRDEPRREKSFFEIAIGK